MKHTAVRNFVIAIIFLSSAAITSSGNWGMTFANFVSRDEVLDIGTRTFDTPVPTATYTSTSTATATATATASATATATPYCPAGSLDATFNGSGKVITSIGGHDDAGFAVAIQSDGKIVVAGSSYNGSLYDFAVVRYNVDGSLDTSFNGTGKVTTAFGFGESHAFAVAIQSDGKIVVGGWAFTGFTNDFAVARYNSDGTLDMSFNGNGKATTGLGSDRDEAYGVAIQSDGKIVLAGTSFVNGNNLDFAAVRYDSSGNLDTSFNSTGKVVTRISSNVDVAHSVAIQADGKIVLGGSNFFDFALVRYNVNGSLDTSFSADGIVTTSLSSGNGDAIHGIAIQPDGRIVAAGAGPTGANYHFALARYTNSGTLDSTFNGSGIVTAPIASSDEARSVALQPDGKIVAAGFGIVTGIDRDFALARYNINGSLDTSFNGTGKVTTGIAAADYAYAIAIQSDGRIVVAGSSHNGADDDFAVVRYFGATTPCPSVTPTNTPTPTETVSPTPTATITNTPTASPTPTPCGPGSSWQLKADFPFMATDMGVASDGESLFAAGGSQNGTTIKNTMYRYDPGTNSWTALANVPAAFMRMGAAYSPISNSIYLFGGVPQSGPASNATNIYNISTNTWSTGAPMPGGRFWNSAVYYAPANKFYVIGGVDSSGGDVNTVWEYDPVANSWNTSRQTAPIPFSGAAAAIDGQYVYLAGGLGISGTSDHFRYDIVNNTWLTLAPLPFSIFHGIGASFGGKFYVMGGGNLVRPARESVGGKVNEDDAGRIAVPEASFRSTLIYDPASNSWASGPPMNEAHSYASGGAIGNRLMVVAGRNGNFGTITTTVEMNTIVGDCPVPTPTITATATNTPTLTATSTATATFTPTPLPEIGGVVTYPNAVGGPIPVSDVLVTGDGSPDVFSSTGGDGTYILTGFGAGSYTVSLSKEDLFRNGVTSFDAARITQHVLGINRFNANQETAADVSGNGLINSFDAALIIRYVLFLSGSGTTGTWIFTPTNRVYSPPIGVLTGEDYLAFLMGDVSGDWTENGGRVAVGPERSVAIELPNLSQPGNKEMIIPVNAHGIADKGVVAYEFDLRYDPSVVQPIVDAADVNGTVSRGLVVVTNAVEPGLLRVAVYGAIPIDENGLLLNLRFTVVGAADSISPLTFERIMFNEGEPRVTVTNGELRVEN